MTTTAQLTRAGLEHAITVATPRGKALEGLNAPPNGAASGRLDEIWSSIVGGLRKAYEVGANKVQEIASATSAAVRSLIQQAGEAADWLRERLREALQKLVRDCIEQAIASLVPSYKVGNSELRLKTLDVGQKISLSGEIEASIQRVFSLMAAGELSVSASYG